MGAPPSVPGPQDLPQASTIKMEVADRAVTYTEQGAQWTHGQSKAGHYGGLASAIAAGVSESFAIAISTIAGEILGFLNILVKVNTTLTSPEATGFYDFTKSLIEDLLGIRAPLVKASDLTGFQPITDRIKATAEVGRELFTALEEEIVQQGGITPEGGEAAVAAFTGFLLTFSVREALATLALDWLPGDILKELRHVAVDMAENLGLGRLNRVAMRPFADLLIAQPYEWFLNKKYRPKAPGESVLVGARIRGVITDDVYREWMRRLGYTEDFISAIQEYYQNRISITDIENLLDATIIDPDKADDLLKKLAYPEEDRQLALQAVVTRRLTSLERAKLSYFESLFGDSLIDRTEWDFLVGPLALNSDEKLQALRVAGFKQEYPNKRATESQMHSAFLKGLIDLAEFEAFLTQEHYTEDARYIILQLALLDLATDAAKKKSAQLAADRAAAKAQASTGGTAPTGGSTPSA